MSESVIHDRCFLIQKEQICQCFAAIFQVILEDSQAQTFLNVTIIFSYVGYKSLY